MKIAELLEKLTAGKALVLGVVLAILYYFLMFDDGSSQRAAIAANQSRMIELEKQIEDNNRKLEQALAFKKTATEVGGTITKLLKLIPEKFSMADMMRIISNEAKVAGSSMASLTPKTTLISPMAREFEELTIGLDLSGSFLQHMTFLSNLTKMNQILVVRKFAFVMAKEGRGDEPTVTRLNADIVAYRYRGSAVLDREKEKPK